MSAKEWMRIRGSANECKGVRTGYSKRVLMSANEFKGVTVK